MARFTGGPLFQAATASLLLRAGNVVLALLATVVMARVLGPSEFGQYAYILAITIVISEIAQVGLPNLIVRETASSAATADWGLMRGIWRWSNYVVGSITLVIAVIGYAAASTYAHTRDEAWVQSLAIAFIIVPIMALASLRGAALRGLHKVIIGQFPESILRPGLVILVTLTVVLLLGSGSLGSSDAILIYLVAATSAFLVGAGLLKLHKPPQLDQVDKPQFEVARWTRAMLPLALLTTTQVVNKNADLLVLGIFVPSDDVGVYRVVAQGGMLVILGLEAANMVVAPSFAKSHTLNESETMQRVARLSARTALFIATPVAVAFWLYGAEILTLVFGSSYARGYTALCIIVGGQLVNALFGSVGLILIMTGLERWTLRALVVCVITNIVLCFILIPPFGVIGAAIATTASMMIRNLILFVVVRKSLGIVSLPFGR